MSDERVREWLVVARAACLLVGGLASVSAVAGWFVGNDVTMPVVLVAIEGAAAAWASYEIDRLDSPDASDRRFARRHRCAR